MKAEKQVSEGTPFNVDDQRKQIMDCDLRVCTWNIRKLNRDRASATLAETLIKCGAHITAIWKMRRIGQASKRQEHYKIYYSGHAKNREFGCGFVVGKRLRHLVSGFRVFIILA